MINCEVCGIQVVARSVAQKYCEVCSIKKDRDRKAAWARKNYTPPSGPEREKRSRAATNRRLAQQRAAHDLRDLDGSPSWEANGVGRDLAWLVRVAVPFDYSLSKNAMWSMRGGGGHVFLRQKARGARNAVRDRVAAAVRMSKIRPVDAKVFVDIFVQKPDNKGDAINVVDSVCDGVKDAIGIDDRWFCLRGLDWEVVKSGTPRIWIGVGQEVTEHHRVCSCCGRILPLDAFGKRTADKVHGKARVCRECLSAPKAVLS